MSDFIKSFDLVRKQLLYYCLKCKEKKTDSSKTKKQKIVFSSNCAVSGNKKFRFIKEQEPIGLLSVIDKIPFAGP